MTCFGIKNKLYVMFGREDVMLDVGRRRFCLRWLSAEDGKTWAPAAYTFVRTWSY